MADQERADWGGCHTLRNGVSERYFLRTCATVPISLAVAAAVSVGTGEFVVHVRRQSCCVFETANQAP